MPTQSYDCHELYEILKHKYRSLVSEKEGMSGFYENQIFAD